MLDSRQPLTGSLARLALTFFLTGLIAAILGFIGIIGLAANVAEIPGVAGG